MHQDDNREKHTYHRIYYRNDAEIKANLEKYVSSPKKSSERQIALGKLLGYTNYCSDFSKLVSGVIYTARINVISERSGRPVMQRVHLWGEKIKVSQINLPQFLINATKIRDCLSELKLCKSTAFEISI